MKEEGRNEEPEDLRERTIEFGLRIVKMFGQLPKTDEARAIGRQVVAQPSESADYVLANPPFGKKSSMTFTNAHRLLELFQQDRTRLQNEAASVLRLHEALQLHPLLFSRSAVDLIQATAPTVNNGFKKLELEALGIVHELTGGNYGRLYGYTAYLDILNEGGEPL